MSSSLVFAAGLALLSQAHGIAGLALASIVIGTGMGFGLYEAAFATVTRVDGDLQHRCRRHRHRPFRLLRWVPGERLALTRNPEYWGAPTPWENVTFRPVPNNTARLAALLSGDVDMIDKAPTVDIARLRDTARFNVFVHDGNRTMFWWSTRRAP